MTAAKPRIPIDASALSTLHCPRRYQLTCVEGVDTSNEYSQWGSAFHVFLEHVAKFGPPENLMAFVLSLVAKYKMQPAVAPTLYGAALDWLSAKHTIPPAINWVDDAGQSHPAVEFKFAFDLMETEEFIISLCGTVDLITRTDEGLIILEDYKTSNYCKGLDDVEKGYMQTIQLPLYMFALRRLRHLFPAYADDIARGTVGRYRMIYQNFKPIKVRYTGIVPEWPEADLLQIITPLIRSAVETWRMRNKAPMLGRAVGACVKLKCPFFDHCSERDEQLAAQYLTNFPRRQYNPLAFR